MMIIICYFNYKVLLLIDYEKNDVELLVEVNNRNYVLYYYASSIALYQVKTKE